MILVRHIGKCRSLGTAPGENWNIPPTPPSQQSLFLSPFSESEMWRRTTLMRSRWRSSKTFSCAATYVQRSSKERRRRPTCIPKRETENDQEGACVERTTLYQADECMCDWPPPVRPTGLGQINHPTATGKREALECVCVCCMGWLFPTFPLRANA